MAVTALLFGVASAVSGRSIQGAAPAIWRDATGSGVGLIVEPRDGVKPVTRILNAAQHVIFLDAYILTSRPIVRALERAASEGVRVYVMLEERALGMGTQPIHMANELRAAGIEYRAAPRSFALDHIKVMVVDDRVAVIASANMSRSAFTSNREFLVVDREPSDVRAVSEIFRADWDRLSPVFRDPHLVVSPLNARSDTLALLVSAHVSIWVYAEEVKDGAVEAALRSAARRGIQVRVLVPSLAAVNDPAALSAAGVAVRTQSTPYVHAKAIIVDGREAFVGSENLSTQSLDRNREMGILLRGATLGALVQTFAQDWARLLRHATGVGYTAKAS